MVLDAKRLNTVLIDCFVTKVNSFGLPSKQFEVESGCPQILMQDV
jgi:hypothetical protein